MSGSAAHPIRGERTRVYGGYAIQFSLCEDVFARVCALVPMPDGSLSWRIRQCLLEAVGNAIEHGNRGDPARAVEVRWQVAHGVLEVGVANEGERWRPDFAHARRGLHILVCAADRVGYNRDANEIVMRFRVPRAAGATRRRRPRPAGDL